MKKFNVGDVGEEFKGYIGFEPLFFEEKLEYGEAIQRFAESAQESTKDPKWDSYTDEEKLKKYGSTMLTVMRELLPIVKMKIVEVYVEYKDKKYGSWDDLNRNPSLHPILPKFIIHYANNMSLGNE